MQGKLVLIDGHSILNRAYFGVPDLTNSQGLHTNAVYGFLNIMFKILDEEQPDYFAVAFDLHAPTFRHKMYDAYKGTRKPMQEELRQQVPVMKEMLTAMGVPLMMLEGYEADDLLGTAAKKAEADGLSVSIISGDRDLLQLATDRIKVRIPKTKKGKTEVEDYNTEEVVAKYMVTPSQIVDLKALMGDASDNIPGIPGVGEKTAGKIIAEYGSIENAYAHVEEIKPNKAKESLREHYDLAQLSKKLAKINTESPFVLDMERAKMGNLFTQDAFELCRKLEFRNILPRFSLDAPVDPVSEFFFTVTDFSEAETVFTQAQATDGIGFSLLAEKGQLYGIALALDTEHIYFVKKEGFLTESYLTEKCVQILHGSNMAYTIDLKEQLVFLRNGISSREQIADAAIGAYLLNPLKGQYPCEDIAKDYASLMMKGRSELFGKESLAKVMEERAEEAAEYACYHAYTALAATPVILEKLQELKVLELFWNMEMPLVYTLYDMQEAGIRVNAQELKAYGEELYVRIVELEKEIYQEAGEEFNINSPKQLGVILFEKLKLPGAKKTKSGFSTAADVLEKLAPDHVIVAKILEYRQLAKLKSTYADGLANFISADGRIHGTFNQTITATGRISSTDPNLQNIPVRTELGRLLRKVFIAREGYVLIDADYSQIELRVLAHIADDETMINAFKNNEDIHAVTASQVLGIPLDEVTKEQRSSAKAVNFGIVYGIGEFSLSQDIHVSVKEAKAYIDSYLEKYHGVRNYMESIKEQAKKDGYVKTMMNRIRYIPELKSPNFNIRQFGERVALNTPIQGTAADIIKLAMVRVDNRLINEGLKSRLILQVHDELIVETALDEVDKVKQILTEEMQGAMELKVPLKVDISEGHSWYDAK